MRYRRALLFAELGTDSATELTMLRRAAPQLEHLLILVTPPLSLAWPRSGQAAELDAAANAGLQVLATAAVGAAPELDVQLAPELPSDAVAALCKDHAIDLVVLNASSVRATSALLVQRKRLPVAILWTRGPQHAGPMQHLGCVAPDRRSFATVAAFLRDRADPSLSVAILSARTFAQPDLAARLELSGIGARVEVCSPPEARSLRTWIEQRARERPLDLLVFARARSALAAGSLWAGPMLLLPPLTAAAAFDRRALDVCDVVDDRGVLRARIDQSTALGGLEPVPDQPLAIVSAGRIQRTLATREGEVQLPADLSVASLGVYRLDGAQGLDPLLAIEGRVRLIRPTVRELWLYDAELAPATLDALETLHTDLIAVRLRPTRTCRVIRQRLREAGLPPLLIDARAVLDEGDALDVSEPLDALRLARVAARLRQAGFRVAGIVYRGAVRPTAHGCLVWSERDLLSEAPAHEQAADSSSCRSGNAIELELDNTKARHWLLEAIAQSARSLHLQFYMALDDDIGRRTCEALTAAAARGVSVRLLVDSLHGMHGSFGSKNPLLEKLAAVAGIELRTYRPISELPSLIDLKQRDHRKLVIADERVALVGGRNLSHEYYVGFDEVPLTAASDWRLLPWLDAGARLEGPVVADLQRAFREAWVDAGGANFEIAAPPPLGTCAARVVVHRGLRDANTLETYLELIASAKAHVYVVNGFPLLLELQHALLGAIRRGVQVRVLLGHVTPTHGSQPFAGSWSTARMAATELVHSRLDPLVAAGARAYLFALRDVPGWSQGLGIVHPHVHAKALSVDGVRCSVGSANLDITASYWESELLVVVEDAATTQALEKQLDALIATSTAVRADDAAWQESANVAPGCGTGRACSRFERRRRELEQELRAQEPPAHVLRATLRIRARGSGTRLAAHDSVKLLIAYASTHGHTARIAERVAARMQEHGHDVTVSDRLERLRVAAFDAIIVGGRVHGSRYPWRVTRFIRKHLAVLRSHPSAFFSVSLLQLSRDPRRRAETLALPGRVSAALGWRPDRLAVFGGALRWKAQYGVLSPLAKLMWRHTLGPALAPAQTEQIFTDWHAVDEFADAFSRAAAQQVSGALPDVSNRYVL